MNTLSAICIQTATKVKPGSRIWHGFQRWWPAGNSAPCLLCAFCVLVAIGLAVATGLHRPRPTLESSRAGKINLRAGLSPNQRVTANIDERSLDQAFVMYADLTGRT